MSNWHRQGRDVLPWGNSTADPAITQPITAATWKQIQVDGNGNLYAKMVANNAGTPVNLDTVNAVAEGIAPTTEQALLTWNLLSAYDGNNVYKRLLSSSPANFASGAASRGNRSLLTVRPPGWCVSHNPGVSNKATVTFPNPDPGEGLVLVCTGILVRMGMQETNNLAGTLVRLIDGDTGGSPVLWESTVMGGMIGMAVPTADPTLGLPDSINLQGLSLAGSPDNNMTLEFATGIVDAIQSVSLFGYTLDPAA
jgi:hypothetical protein